MKSAGREKPTTATVGNDSSMANTGIGASNPDSRRPRACQSRFTAPVARQAAAARHAPRASSSPPATAATISVRANASSLLSRGSNHRKIGSAIPSAQTVAHAAGSTRSRNSSAARDAGA